MKLSIIAAVAENGVIGKNGELPWRLKSDLQRFKQLTYGKTVIVGRKTHESILLRLGHPLEGRRTIVVTRDRGYASECEVAHSFPEALGRARNDGEVFVIGGAELYREALPLADRLYLTRVFASPQGGAFFPPWNEEFWKIMSSEFHGRDADNEYDFTFAVLQRKMAGHAARYVNLANARYADQRAFMEEINRAGVCPFCPEHRTQFPLEPAVREGRYWVLVPNRWPYKSTRLHLLAVLQRHAITLRDLAPKEWAELLTLLQWVEEAYVPSVVSGAIGIRFGDPNQNGASVEHLHAHLIIADPDVTRPGYERVRFPMGPKPPTPPQENAPSA